MAKVRRATIILAATVSIVVIGIVLVGAVWNWGIPLHWGCRAQGQIAEIYTFTPAVLVNSPFGGKAWGNGTIPGSWPDSPGYPNNSGAFGTGSLNGSPDGVFFAVNMSLHRMTNVLDWGPGRNSRCTASLTVEPARSLEGPGFGGWSIPVVSNTTDAGEATTVDFSGKFIGNPVAPIWNNSFTVNNSEPVDTCNAPPHDSYSLSFGLRVTFDFTFAGSTTSVSTELPFEEVFHYHFPANFGIWQIDNLSAPGGPGGGWAFSYAPCS